MKETSPEHESRPPRTREASPVSSSAIWLLEGGPDQLKEDRISTGEESDSLIVVRDGRTDHKPARPLGVAEAKRRAGPQSSQSTHARGKNVPEGKATRLPKQSVSRTLTALNQKANRAFLGLIRKWLRAGVLENVYEDGKLIDKRIETPLSGTPQGGLKAPRAQRATFTGAN